MFFIGLAGSFMPYLLFLGALFVLTLGASMKPATETLALQEKTIEHQAPETQEIQSKSDCYFYASIENAVDQQSVVVSPSTENTGISVYHPRGRTFYHHVPDSYHFQTYHTFFGLSPPTLIS